MEFWLAGTALGVGDPGISKGLVRAPFRALWRRHTDEVVTGDGLDDVGADNIGVVVVPLVEVMVSMVAVGGSTSEEGSSGQDSCLHISEFDHCDVCEILEVPVGVIRFFFVFLGLYIYMMLKSSIRITNAR